MKLAKVYEPNQYEADIYALWEKSGAFKPTSKHPSYGIVMPPPNANANLHIGYELTAALEDIAARYHRLKGESVLLLPGADHAGFETQSVYEKHLAKSGKSRFDFNRDELYEQIWDFVALNKTNFQTQIRRMGVSCSWEDFTFTLDKKVVERAYQTFKRMWDDGLIYRGERLVNFCTFHGTAFADIEVVYKSSKGHLWYLRYPLVDGDGEVVVATTRPETMLGDTAVAVNPKDKRYKHLIGKTVKLPLTQREIPIIADDFVDMDFGTGAVKLTPAHDINDFEAGQRHNLPSITVIDYEGKMTEAAGVYHGLTVDQARNKVVDDLKDQGFLVKTEDYQHNVGHCYKCDTVIQPLLREQWFINMQPLAERAIKALEQDRITFYPEAKKDQLVSYLKGLHDWNISRQIAWGIPIPAFQNVDDPDDWIYDERVSEEILVIGDKTYRRDPDVFDTWFSSSSWPYATLDFPSGNNFKNFYPLGLMETGGEILYPWVSRMLMLGLYVTGKIPFKSVYIHGYVMADDGSKMSKSVGNVVDPLPVIDKYGSDALRIGIIWGRAPAVNRGYDPRRVEEAKNFCNKVWNIARYIENLSTSSESNLERSTEISDSSKLSKLSNDKNSAIIDAYDDTSIKPITEADHWILGKLSRCQTSLVSNMDNYNFSESFELLYHFIWDDFADWYIESNKQRANIPLLNYVLESTLILLHPFAPFLTETIWQTLNPYQDNSLLINKTLPESISFKASRATEFEDVKLLVNEIRSMLKQLKTTQSKLIYDSSDTLVAKHQDLIKSLGRIKSVEQGSGGTVKLVSSKVNRWLEVDHKTIDRYLSDLQAKQDHQATAVSQLEQRLSNSAYIKNAPKKIVAQTRQDLADAQSQLQAIKQELKQFQ